MKTYLKIFMGIIAVSGGMIMSNHDGSCSGSRYEAYSSQDPEINVTMEYPSGWQYQEHRGSYGSYAQVQFYGEVQDGFAPSIVLTVEREEKVSFAPLTLEGMADDLAGKRMKLAEAQILSKTNTTILDVPAVDMTWTYKQPRELYSIDLTQIGFQERMIIFQKDGRFYTLRYVNPQAVFADYEEDFARSIETFLLKP